MRFEDEFIGSCLCWDDFWRRATSLATDAEKGATFERLTQLYLQTAPEYQSTLRAVWTLAEVPTDVRTRLHLVKRDEGIDLIAETRRGEYWAIQCKFRSNRDQPLTWRELSTFTSLAFVSCRGIALAVVAHTCSKPVGKRHLMGNTVEIGLDRWLSLDDEAWSLLQTKLNRKRPHPQPRTPMPHQQAAIEAATTHFVQNGAARGRLIMPCGTGKSLTAFWIAEALKTKSILVAVSSLALVRQSLADWTREYLARGIIPDWVCVCSDDTVGKLDEDEFVSEAYDLGIPTHTDPTEIAALIQRPRRQQREPAGPSIWLFSMRRTRQSGRTPGNLQRF